MIKTYNFLFLSSPVAEVGFQSAMYTAVEGEEEAVTVCVSVLSGNLTEVISLDYTLSVLQMTAAGQVLSHEICHNYDPIFLLFLLLV